MANLYVTEQNAWIRKRGDRLVVERDGETLMDVPCLKLDAVLIYGNVQFTTQALAEMLDHGIEMALFTVSGRLRGQLTPPKAKNVPLRMAQYERSRSPGFRLGVARSIVAGKIANQRAVLRRYHRNHPEVFGLEELEPLEELARAAGEAGSIESLRGIEGTAAARYFKLMAATVPAELGFAGRNRRPPRDPVNALLSFGYVLVGNELQALLDGIGFDPYLGLYHAVDYGRPSLALDLLEEFRPALVDRLTASLLNLGTLSREDFVARKGGGVYLSGDSRAAYFTAFEKHLNRKMAVEDGEGESSFRELFRRQAHRLARAIEAGEPYEPFRLPC